MNVIKVIKNNQEYEVALKEIESLMDAEPGSADETALELLSVVIEKYEKEHFPIPLPDPIDAIKFRMEQQGLSQKDLIPFIGSQGKVSEVLNHKRQLSMEMVRKLYEGLNIPAEVLIQKAGASLPTLRYNRMDFPFNEMFNRGYFSFFSGPLHLAKQHAEECLEKFFTVFQGKEQTLVLCKNSDGDIDNNALLAWQAQVLNNANQLRLPDFDPERFGPFEIEKIVHLSAYTTGPLKARDYLANLGIPLIILEHLPHTYLDGACFLNPNGRPVIGMTLRHDRQDNFWFTLIHELAHVYLHLLKGDDSVFTDNTERVDLGCDGKEHEANSFCADQLIPPEDWAQVREKLVLGTDQGSIVKLAEELSICPAIIAGRVRYETSNYSLYENMLGRGEVRNLFLGVN